MRFAAVDLSLTLCRVVVIYSGPPVCPSFHPPTSAAATVHPRCYLERKYMAYRAGSNDKVSSFSIGTARTGKLTRVWIELYLALPMSGITACCLSSSSSSAGYREFIEEHTSPANPAARSRAKYAF